MTSSSSRSESSITNDELFVTLSDSARRQILSELALCSQRRNVEVDPEDIVESAGEIDRFKIELHHHHLSRLEAAGIINWNQETDIITKGERFEEIRPLIELLHEHQDKLPLPWP